MGGLLREGDYNFSIEKETKIVNWEQVFFSIPHNSISS